MTVTDWHRVQRSQFGDVWYFYGGVWSGRQFVLGGVMRGQTPSGNDGIRFWSSPDGAHWTTSPERSWGAVQAYAFDGMGGGVAVGSLGDRASVWVSDDGVRWTKLPDQLAFLPAEGERASGLFAVAHGGGMYVALGGGGDDVSAFISGDGRDWTRLPRQPFAGAENVQIAAAGGRFVVGGMVDRDTAAAHIGLWASADGRSWSELPDLGSQPPTDFDRLTAGPAGWLVTGTDFTASATEWSAPVHRAWRSLDGLEWTETEWIVPPAGSTNDDQVGLTATPWGFVVVDRHEFAEPSPASTPDPLASPAPESSPPPPPVERVCYWHDTDPWACLPEMPSTWTIFSDDHAVSLALPADGGDDVEIWVATVEH